jgi:hypothetical protein
MTNENDSDQPAANPQGQPLLQPPVNPPTPLQGALSNDGERDADDGKNETKELAREFRIAEKWVIGTNIVLALIGLAALCIYNGQLKVMQGQLAEIIKQYPEMKKSADAAKSAADTADSTLKATQKSFIIDQRPYMVIDSGPEFVAPGLIVDKPVCANIAFKNIGKTPAVQVVTHIQFLPFRGKLIAKLTSEERKKARSEYISFIESTFAKLRADDEKSRKEILQLTKLSAGSDVAPAKTFFVTSPEVSVSGIDMPAVKTGEITLFYTGILSYIDSYGVTYRTEFCSSYFGADQRIWHICDAHNTIR